MAFICFFQVTNNLWLGVNGLKRVAAELEVESGRQAGRSNKMQAKLEGK